MSIPTDLTPRFEVRKLDAKDTVILSAIISHCNVFHSPMWAVAYPDDQIKRCFKLHHATDYLKRVAIESGLTYGVYDKEYKFKRPESAATGGALYWDRNNLTATAQQLLDEIDSPLVSVCMARDAFQKLDMSQMSEILEIMPTFGLMREHRQKVDKRDPKSWEPTAFGQVISRMGTATRSDYEGMGLMKLMAHWEMRDAAAKGFRAITIDTLHPAVHHVWMNPPAPFKATYVDTFNMNELTVEKDGQEVVVTPNVDVLAGCIYVELA